MSNMIIPVLYEVSHIFVVETFQKREDYSYCNLLQIELVCAPLARFFLFGVASQSY